MPRARRFESHRYLGTRDDMVVYDCDQTGEFEVIERRLASDDLVGRKLIQTFGPDTEAEARNRGFRRP